MDKKRIFRLVVCLILVCCVLVNISPIRSEAVATGTSVAGWTALLFFVMASAGIVCNVEIPSEPPAIIEQAEEALDNYVLGNYEAYFPDIDPDNDDDTDLEQFWDDLKNGVNECFEKAGNFKNLGDYLPQETFADWVYEQADLVTGAHAIGIGSKLWQLLANWFMDIYDKGFFELGGSTAETGMAYYNNWYLPVLPESPPCIAITYEADLNRFMCYMSSTVVPYIYIDESDRTIYFPSGGRYGYYVFYPDSSTWTFGSSKNSGVGFSAETLCWTNFDIYDKEGNLVMSGSEPSDTQTITVEPDLFFGDYADQHAEGTLSPSSFQFPLYDFSDYLYDQESTQAEMQQLYDQISNGQVTYNDYIQNITYSDSTGDNIGGDSSDSSGTDDPEAIPEDLAGYTLELSDFFPFCIPFDIYEFLALLSAEPEAPRFEFTFNFGEYLGVHTLVIDLSEWDSTAQLLRRFELLLFIIGLAMATRNYYIRG